jgi:hypothetical protein
MRKPITMRFDPDLLAQARLRAARENRTLTNFIETVVRERVGDSPPTARPSASPSAEPPAGRRPDTGRNC